MCNFIADDEFDILNRKRGYFGSKLITHEQTVLDFDRAQNEFVMSLGVLEIRVFHNKL